MLALEIHFQRQIRNFAACFQLCSYSIPFDGTVIWKKVRIIVPAIIMKMHGKELVSIAGKAIGVWMDEVFMPLS